jgi:hypothetical protein
MVLILSLKTLAMWWNNLYTLLFSKDTVAYIIIYVFGREIPTQNY